MGAGALLPLVPRRTLDFGALKSSGSLIFPIAKNVPVHRWLSGVLLVRLHSVKTGGLGSRLSLAVLSSLPSAEDPDRDFMVTLESETLGTSAPALEILSLNLIEASFVTVMLRGTGALSFGGGPTVTLSADLVVRAAS